MRMEDAPPEKHGRHFYAINENEDGSVDVYLRPVVYPEEAENGITDYDVAVLAVKGVTPYEGIEEDIRARYYDWCMSAERIYL